MIMKITRKLKMDNHKTDDFQSIIWKVLIVDDEPDIHTITRLNLKTFKFLDGSLQFLQAFSAQEAKEILATEPDIAVAFIDIIMETEDAGLKLVEFIRKQLHNTQIRLIVRSGQVNLTFEESILVKYDLSGYKDKTDLTSERLHQMMKQALQTYQTLTTS
jgi:CheY-like chemotaxis protein